MIGRKLFVKIILEISSNYDFNEISKKMNTLFNWAIHLKHFRNLEYEEIELNNFIFDILNELFEGIREKYENNLKRFQECFNRIFYLELDLKNNETKITHKINNEIFKNLKENYFNDLKNSFEESKNNLNQGIIFSNLFAYQNDSNLAIINLINFSFIFYEYLSFFNISKNPFICIKSLNPQNFSVTSERKINLIPEVILENNLFNLLYIFSDEKILNKNSNFKEFNNNIHEDNKDENKNNNYQYDVNFKRRFNKLYLSFLSLNKNLMENLSFIWKNNIPHILKEESSNEDKLTIIKQENIDVIIGDFILEKENKNFFLNVLSILFLIYNFEDNDTNNKEEKYKIGNEKNYFVLGLLNDEIKIKIRTLLNLKKTDLMQSNLSQKDRLNKTKDIYMKSKKSFYFEFEKILKEIYNQDYQLVKNDDNNGENKLHRKESSKETSEKTNSKKNSISLIEIVNSLFILNIENLREEFKKINYSEILINKMKKEFIYWLREYQTFIIFLCISSSNIKSKNNENYEYYNDRIIEIILYSIIYIFDWINIFKENVDINKNYIYLNILILFKNIFGFMISIYKNINDKKRKKSFMIKFISQKKNKDLLSCPIYKIFDEILIKSVNEKNQKSNEKQTLLTSNFIEEFRKCEDAKLFELMKKYEFHNYLLYNIDFIQKRIDKNFDLDTYVNILANRTKAAEKTKSVDLYFIFRNYRTSNFILYNISKNKDPFNIDLSIQKCKSENMIFKNIKINKENNKRNIDNFISTNNLNKLYLKDEDEMINYDLIKKNLSNFELEITKFYYRKLFENLNCLNKFKKQKGKLFTWNGLWSEKDLFYNPMSKDHTKLKWKMMNHCTKFFYKPLIKNIYNTDLYFSNNSKFNTDIIYNPIIKKKSIRKNSSSNKNNDLYILHNGKLEIKKIVNNNENIMLIDSIDEKLKEILHPLNLNENITSYIENYKKVWKNIENINNLNKRFFETNIFSDNSSGKDFILPQNVCVKNILECIYDLKQFKEIYNIFEICLIKITSHIKCFLKFNNSGFDIFTNFEIDQTYMNSNKNNINQIDFDTQKQDCFGSFIKSDYNQNKYNKFYRNFKFNDIQIIFKRDFYLMQSAVEIFIKNKSYYINFLSKEQRNKFLRITKANIQKIIKIKIENINQNNFNNRDIFGIRKESIKSNRSERDTKKNYNSNQFLTLNDINNLGELNSNNKNTNNDYYSLGIQPHTSKNIGITLKREKNKSKKKYITVAYQNLYFDNAFTSINKKVKKFNKLLNFSNNKNIKTDKEFYTSIKIFEIIEQWNKTKKISNFEFILQLNILANRSFTDITQYPVFPWIINNYEKDSYSYLINKYEINSNINENEKNNEKNDDNKFRDLTNPMGMLCKFNRDSSNPYLNAHRKDSYTDIFNNMLEDYKFDESNQTPYFYGSMYSNVIYVTYYLIRLLPFSKLAIEIQGGKFDCYARMFKSISESYNNSINSTGDVRELIPEFYFLPEIFRDINNLNLNKNNGLKNECINETEICSISGGKTFDVILPEWSKNNSYSYISIHKELFEINQISDNLSDWVDLIFGYKQSGKNAIEANNLFFSESYLVNNKNYNLKNMNEEERNLKMKFVEFGLVPKQLLNSKIPKKIKNKCENTNKKVYRRSNSYENNNDQNKKNNFINEKIFSFNEIEKFKNQTEKTIKLLKIRYVQENNYLVFLFNDNSIFQIMLNNLFEKDVVDYSIISRKILLDNLRFKENYDYENLFSPFSLKMPEFYEENDAINSEKVIYISKNGKVNKLIFQI